MAENEFARPPARERALLETLHACRAERDRYRQALEKIAAQGTHDENWKHWREIAREALDG